MWASSCAPRPGCKVMWFATGLGKVSLGAWLTLWPWGGMVGVRNKIGSLVAEPPHNQPFSCKQQKPQNSHFFTQLTRGPVTINDKICRH